MKHLLLPILLIFLLALPFTGCQKHYPGMTEAEVDALLEEMKHSSV